VVHQAKIALALVQNWVCKNEVIHVKNTIFFKSPCQENLISNPFQQISLKKFNILLVIEFRRNFEIFLSKFTRKYW